MVNSCCVATVSRAAVSPQCQQLLCRHSVNSYCFATVSTADVSPHCVHRCCVATLCSRLLCRHRVSPDAVSPRCVHTCCVATVCRQLLCQHSVHSCVSPHCVYDCCVATLCCQYQTNALCQTVADQSQFTTVYTDGWKHFQASNISRQSLLFPSSKSLGTAQGDTCSRPIKKFPVSLSTPQVSTAFTGPYSQQ